VVEYNPEVIVAHANRLYKKADAIVRKYTTIGAIFGLFFGGVLIGFLRLVGEITRTILLMSDTSKVIIISGFILGFALLGHSLGEEKAFNYRLQAQIALTQVQIEKNTRANISENKLLDIEI
jgi:hypothetical protein